MTLITFIPPPVEPAQAPVNAPKKIRYGSMFGHVAKSVVENPVVVNIDTTSIRYVGVMHCNSPEPRAEIINSCADS